MKKKFKSDLYMIFDQKMALCLKIFIIMHFQEITLTSPTKLPQNE